MGGKPRDLLLFSSARPLLFAVCPHCLSRDGLTLDRDLDLDLDPDLDRPRPRPRPKHRGHARIRCVRALLPCVGRADDEAPLRDP